jgi:hypothetical protein
MNRSYILPAFNTPEKGQEGQYVVSATRFSQYIASFIVEGDVRAAIMTASPPPAAAPSVHRVSRHGSADTSEFQVVLPPRALQIRLRGTPGRSRWSELLAQVGQARILRDGSADARGWLIEAIKCVEAIGKPEFQLEDVYAALSDPYPNNMHLKQKIRQQL